MQTQPNSKRWSPRYWFRFIKLHKRQIVLYLCLSVFGAIFWLKVASAMYILTILASLGIVWWAFTHKTALQLVTGVSNHPKAIQLMTMTILLVVVLILEGFVFRSQIINFVSPPISVKVVIPENAYIKQIVTHDKDLSYLDRINGKYEYEMIVEFGTRTYEINPVSIQLDVGDYLPSPQGWWDEPLLEKQSNKAILFNEELDIDTSSGTGTMILHTSAQVTELYTTPPYFKLRVPKKACPNDDFLLRRTGFFRNPVLFTFQSLFQVTFTSFFKGNAAILGLILAVNRLPLIHSNNCPAFPIVVSPSV